MKTHLLKNGVTVETKAVRKTPPRAAALSQRLHFLHNSCAMKIAQPFRAGPASGPGQSPSGTKEMGRGIRSVVLRDCEGFVGPWTSAKALGYSRRDDPTSAGVSSRDSQPKVGQRTKSVSQ